MIERAFFARDPLTCARELIGAELTWGECAGLVVETEAYFAVDDEACHTFMRPSARAFIAQHAPGDAYVYMNYGVHWLLNILVKDGPADGFVLIRALEPRRGFEQMAQRRGTSIPTALCSGPGKLSQALGISGVDHGRPLCSDPQASFTAAIAPVPVATDVRIGISRAAHLPWRFLLAGNPHISVPIRSAKKLPTPAPKRKKARPASPPVWP